MKSKKKVTRKKKIDRGPALYLEVEELRAPDGCDASTVPSRHVRLLITHPAEYNEGAWDTGCNTGSLCIGGLKLAGLLQGAKYRLVRIRKGRLSEADKAAIERFS